MGIVVHGGRGAVGTAAAAWLDAAGRPWSEAADASAAGDRAGPGTVVVLATPPGAWPSVRDDTAAPERPVTVAPAVDPAARRVVHVADAGWFGGLGSLLAAVAVTTAVEPVAVHVAYGMLPSPGRAWRTLGPTARTGLLDAVGGGGVARVDGAVAPEPLAVGRRLAWFPRPVGPAHAAAVPGHETHAVPGPPTVRTWLAVGSLRAELLQAIGRLDTDGRAWAALRRRAGRPAAGDTASLRWAVVAEVRESGGEVVRSWANGTDPVATTGGLLGLAAARVEDLIAPSGHDHVVHEVGDAPPRSVVDLAPPGRILDELADGGLLRWSVARPTTSPR